MILDNGYIRHSRVIQQPLGTGHNIARDRTNLNNVNAIVLHHTVTGNMPTIQNVNNWWVGSGRNWTRAGYHLLIRNDGSIWQLVPVNAQSWGAANHNHRAIHIAFAGSFTANSIPSKAARDSFGFLVRLLLDASQLPNVSQPSHVIGHRIVGATACPGFTQLQYRSWIPARATTPTPSTPSNNAFQVGTHNGDVEVTVDVLNVRELRNANSRQVGQLRRGQVVRVGFIMFENNQTTGSSLWGGVTVNGVQGFINLNFVRPVVARRVQIGSRVRVNQNAQTWATGTAIPAWVRGQEYRVSNMRNNDNEALLEGITSWINVRDVTIV